jgi:hypothetical protein
MKYTMKEKYEIENMPTIGYWSALCGVEVKKIEHGVEDYVICVANAWVGKHTYHRLRVQYTHAKDSRSYVILDGVKLYMDDCLRTGRS